LSRSDYADLDGFITLCDKAAHGNIGIIRTSAGLSRIRCN
jgi:hypothetical protein